MCIWVRVRLCVVDRKKAFGDKLRPGYYKNSTFSELVLIDMAPKAVNAVCRKGIGLEFFIAIFFLKKMAKENLFIARPTVLSLRSNF